MIPQLHSKTGTATSKDDDVSHVLVLVRDAASRFAIAAQLREAGYGVTTAATFGVVELLHADSDEFDVLVTAQSFGEMAQFGLPQLARSVRPDLPIVVLERETILGEGVVGIVAAAISRWPIRELPARCLH